MPLAGKPLHFDKPLCASLDGFTLHAATRAGGLDLRAREALLKYVLRPPIAQERVTQGPDGLVRIVLKHPFADGTVAIDLDPLSLLSRLAASVPAPGRHTVRYAGVLASASKLRPRIVPKPPAVAEDAAEASKPKRVATAGRVEFYVADQAAPTRPFYELAIVQAIGFGSEANPEDVTRSLTAKAGALGCDAVVRVCVDVGYTRAHAAGVCVKYLGPAPEGEAPRRVLPATPSPTNPSPPPIRPSPAPRLEPLPSSPNQGR